ncbi:Nitrate/nitrite response regulator protein [Nitrincola lacisaponensis]|uniref:Nitrate/nitrite response regulator protein n=1 Tax=Nitrincola lacisaponensis TaxID=267850 RepID=A0A063Y9P1_9GAMM|nr:response regulator transcription factor [Nitrincola lacisaponensis]KDE41416.1 Nitrate/nitrite response regulator protein [Nitrincola lacisaponensis]
MALRLLLVDDHALLRQGLAELLGAVPEFDVLGTAASVEQGLQLVQDNPPDIVLLDWHLPGIDGSAGLMRCKEKLPDSLVIILTASEDQADLRQALAAGADGYVLKHAEPEQLVAQLRGCHKGSITLDPRMLESMDKPVTPEPAVVLPVELTEREQQTLLLIADGLSNKLIARELGISDGTVKIHVKHLLTKLNLHSRLELAAWAHRGGFLQAMQASLRRSE